MTHKKGLRITLTIISILGALLSLPMVMMFDAPRSENNPITQLMFYSLLAFPALCLMGGILPWVLKRHPLSIWLYALSGLAVGLFFAAVVLLQIQCGGDFSCS
ncbi:hypothetical protein [Thalassospira sp. GB04J01]|uniref:hypothetical protein n=1 Tax=Thalassospira sp. GB04J01 TaxID=1485225 RepID=UPI001FCC394F|nr:hypothetical protein [Thalassospira sp. GB04J01]|tara:strand:+ start:372839 stop:373147 length:309 start_codon:yes stop_codon:yes gene_type:complete